ncbi:MAG: PEGA domain-containing protein [Patescibacteria group bacterium]|nr:PEGA domain-containing protein [Patescibacteria group bacterium]
MDKKHEKLIKTHLTRPVRLAIMITLVSSFFIISPLLIAYGSGYRYDFTKHRIQKTGVLNINILPKDAEIFLNGEKLKEKIPFNLSLYPDTYLLTITKDGYKTWEKNISVISTKTTYINYFQLLKDQSPLPVELSDIKEILGTDNSENILLLSQTANDKTNIISFNLKNNTTENLANNLDILNYSVSPYNDLAYIITQDATEKNLTIFDLNKVTNSTKINLLDEPKLQWLNNKNNPLVLEEVQTIFSISSSGNKKIVNDFVSTTNWYFDKDSNVWMYHDYTLYLAENNYNLQKNITEIIDINKNRVIAKTSDAYLVYNFQNEKIHNINGDKLFFNQSNKSWIIYSNWDITEIREDGTVNLQYRNGEKIKSLQLLDEGRIYIIQTESEIKAIDIDQYLQFPILNNSQNKTYINKKYREIFYTNSENKLFRLEL